MRVTPGVRAFVGAMSVIAGSSCHSITAPTAPDAFLDGEAKGLVFTTTMSRTTIRVGDTASMTIRLRNPKDTTVRLHFSMGCTVLPYILAGDRQAVYPSGGDWACVASITTLTLVAGGEYVLRVPVRGGVPTQAIYYGAALGPGRYVGFAQISEGMGRSNSVPFEIIE